MTDVTLTNGLNFHALLIGIDCYLPNKLPDGSYYKNLKGCVRDINDVEAFLTNRLQVPETQIIKLTASNVEGSTEPLEPQDKWPTYENMVAKFKEITEKAQPQDQVYIHYSGHGGRAATIYSNLKGKDGIDQSLVPTDIGNPKTRYLRDFELAELLKNMVDKGLVVTVTLDSCHSGGAARNIGDNCDIRRAEGGGIDTTPRPTESLVASADELAQTWQTLAQNNKNTRNVTSSGWLEPKGFTLLAACRDNEYAYETIFDGERQGALTYWLLRFLEKFGTGVTAKTLHDHVFAKVRNQFEKQTPMLQGESGRTFFGNNFVSPQLTVPIIQVDLEENRVKLNAGQAHGLRKGAELAIYPSGTADLTQTHQRLALVEITQLGAVNSWATITQILGESKKENIEEGAPALLLYPNVKLVRKVRLVLPKETDQPLGIDAKVALKAIELAIPEGKGWVELVSGDETADYQVSINSAGQYEILDRAGMPISNLQPALEVNNSNAAVEVVKRLVHLSKYHATIDLDNHDPMSPLNGKIELELFALPDNFVPGEQEELIPFKDSGNLPTLDVERYAYLVIRNKSSLFLNITVLAIQPDWSIKKGYPKGASFQTVDPGQEVKWRINTSLPSGSQEGVDILKVFATIDGTSFDWLELPALDQPMQPKNPAKATTQLAKFLAAFFASEDAPPTKNVNSVAYASEEWTTEQLTLVVKKGASISK